MVRAQARADAIVSMRGSCVKGIVTGVDGRGRQPDTHVATRVGRVVSRLGPVRFEIAAKFDAAHPAFLCAEQ